MNARHRYALRALAPLSVAWLALAGGSALGQDLNQGIESWAEATFGRQSTKWVGQRVDLPSARARPASALTLDSALWPLRVHLSAPLGPAGLGLARAVLASAERHYALLAASGLFAARVDTDPGHSAVRDLFIVDQDLTGAAIDASELVSELDAAPTFALLDARLPERERDACVSQALLDAELLELDPAESPTLRAASARYFTRLIGGTACVDGDPPASPSGDRLDVLHDVDALAAWLAALGARQDHNRGTFVHDIWQFARQRTWEGSGLRGSPDFFEAAAKALELRHEKLEEVAGELANAGLLRELASAGLPKEDPARIRYRDLPAHLPPSPPLAPLDSSYRLVDLEGARPATRLTIWSRGEYGVRWVLSATRLDADGRTIATVHAPVHKHPDTELTLELDADTRFVLVSISSLGTGIPDPDLPWSPERTRSARLIVAVTP